MKIISISSGKGGVGKTSVVSNLALSLSRSGKKTLIFDGDFGMANVDIFFGVHPRKNLQNILNGEPLKECITSVGQNLDLLAGGSGIYELTQLNAFQRREILRHIEDMNFIYDYLVIDTSPGLHDHVLHLNSIADENIVILTPDPSSFTDAYALIKVMYQRHRMQSVSILCNQVQDEKSGAQLYLKFAEVVQQFLPVRVRYLRSIPYDQQLKNSNQLQRLILRQDIKSVSAQALVSLTQDLLSLDQQIVYKPSQPKGLDVLFKPVSGHA